MPLEPGKLRRWIAIAAIALILILAGFYSYARHRLRQAIHNIPGKLGIDVQQSANGFSFSKSEGGHTLFMVRADKAIQYKGGTHAELQNASIVVYGRNADRYDQIYGSKFEYDPSTGIITAEGEVQIDLQSNTGGAEHPDQAPPDEVKNPIHLKTSGLSFNQKTGMAHTSEVVEFRVPQGRGSARGADFDSNAGTLALGSDVDFSAIMPGSNHTQQRTELKADHAVLYQHENQIKLDRASVHQPDHEVQANKVVVTLRHDNTIERVEATGDIRAGHAGAAAERIARRCGCVPDACRESSASATLNGNVTVNLKRPGQPDSNGRADHAELAFNTKNQLEKVHASGGVDFTQVRPASASQAAESREVKADGLDALVKPGNRMEQISTSGAAQVIMVSSTGQTAGDSRKNRPPTQTVITAGMLTAHFDDDNHLHNVHGEPNSRVVSTTPGDPDRVSTADRLDVEFAPSSGAKNGDAIQSVVQEGSFHYQEGPREAWAERARFAAATNLLTLSGSPRATDAQSSISAQEIVLNHVSNETNAHGDVRATYLNGKPQANGGMLSSADATHVTAPAMNANSKTGLAIFTGGARLWQGNNAVDAPRIEFSKTARSLTARSTAQDQVTCSFVMKSQSGKLAPMRLTAALLDYSDAQRRARFSGGVKASGEEGVMQADTMDVLLKAVNAAKSTPANTSGSGAIPAGAGEIDQIIASDNVTLEQTGRKASGDRLVYLPDNGQTTLTGSPGHLPTMTDAEHGTVTGDSLTFYNRDDRVVVDSNGTSRTITQTRVKK